MYFKGQEDVWIQTWNEPYHFNNENNYTHDLWLADAQDMVANLRDIPEFTNIVVVPGNEQGQGEEALLEKAAVLMGDFDALVFDVHAYGKWHDNASQASITARLRKLKEQQIPIIFGEVGVVTEGAPLSDPMPFLASCDALGIGALAWLWNTNTQDQNTLLTDEGDANNTNNNNWGSTFKNFLSANKN